MKKLMSYIMLAITAITFTTCTKEINDSGLSLVWGYTWDNMGIAALKSIDINTGEEIDSISVNKLNDLSENLVYNEMKNEMLYTNYDSLYSINLNTHVISQISFIGDSVFGLRIDNKDQIIYGLIAQDSKYQFISIDLNTNNVNRKISQIDVHKVSDILGTALNSKNGKFYFCANDSLYSYDYLENRIEKTISSNILNIEYNSTTNELIGVGHFNFHFGLIKMDAELNNVQEIEFSQEILAFHCLSTFNYKTGDYIFMGNGYVIHIVDIQTGIVKDINAEFEKGLEFQFKYN